MAGRSHAFGVGRIIRPGVSRTSPISLIDQLQRYRDSLADELARLQNIKKRQIAGIYAPGNAAINAGLIPQFEKRCRELQMAIIKVKHDIYKVGGKIPAYVSAVDRSSFPGTQQSRRAAASLQELFARIVSTPAPPELHADSVLTEDDFFDGLNDAEGHSCSSRSPLCGWIYKYFGAVREMMSVRGGTRKQKRRRRRTQSRRA